MSETSWQTFVAEGSRLATALADAVASKDRAGALDAVTALELDARVVGVPELARLATALRRALETRSGPVATGADAQAAGHAIRDAFALLSQPDRSGAHLDADDLGRVAAALEAGVPALRALAAAPAAPHVEAPVGAADDDTKWTPAVDEDMVDPFLDECQERLAGLAEKLVELERTPDEPELVRALFRDLHTLKGSSAFVGLRRMTRVAHAAEDLIGAVRDGRRHADRQVIDALLASVDVLAAIVQRATARAPIDVEVGPVLAQLSGQPLSPYNKKGGEEHVATTVPEAREATAASPSPPAAAPTIEAKQTLRIDFEKLDVLMNLVGELVLAKGRLGTGVDGLGSLARELDTQRRNAAAISAGPRGERAGSRAGGVRSQDVATELSRVQRAFDQLSHEIDAASQSLELTSGELRDQVMKLRMVPIGRTWSKYHRTVREIARNLGKQVRLELVGAETELDKVLVEQLDDPFLHLVRNAIDHGVEAPAKRIERGKAPEGLLRLSATHRGNQIVLTIEDDGGGIDIERVRDKAVENGIISAEGAKAMDDAQIHDLIFRPGFSTAKQVSDLSGRGVGMDVVRETITRLKGTVNVQSELGKGSRFELRLPLTLAILTVLLARVAGQTLAIPIDIVTRTIAAGPGELRRVLDREVLLDRGGEIPVIRLRQVLGLGGGEEELASLPVALCDIGGETWGIACDGFLGRQEIVIKTLGSLIANVPGVAGATLVGDRPVLILDIPTVVAIAVDPVLAHRRGADAPRAAAASRTGAARARILLAEDAEVVRESMRRALETAGYDVMPARDGTEALGLAQKERFDLVSTDVLMPGLDGYELTRRLRELPDYKNVPIVMVTSKDERVDRIRGFDAGVDDYLTKPVDATELLRVVGRHLASRS